MQLHTKVNLGETLDKIQLQRTQVNLSVITSFRKCVPRFVRSFVRKLVTVRIEAAQIGADKRHPLYEGELSLGDTLCLTHNFVVDFERR